MTDVFRIFTALLWIGTGIAIYFAIRSATNELEFYHLISTKGQDGKYYVDATRIGQCAGVVLCSVVPFIYAYSPNMDAIGLAAILGVALGYLGSVSSYAASLRAKQGTVETVRTAEDSTKIMTESITQTAPIKTAKGVKK